MWIDNRQLINEMLYELEMTIEQIKKLKSSARSQKLDIINQAHEENKEYARAVIDHLEEKMNECKQ